MKFSAGTTFRLNYNEKGGFEKLGDGNYGIVFSADGTGDSSGPYALKIIYKHQSEGANTDNPAELAAWSREDRVREELLVTMKVAHNIEMSNKDHRYKDGLRQSYKKYLVLPIDYSFNIFDETIFENDAADQERFNEAIRELEKKDVILSGYAYLMEKFTCSLKDIFEGNPLSTDIGNGSTSGYQRLAETRTAEREKSALHVLEGVAEGLNVLHVAGLRHQDIKPANIYYRDLQGVVEFRLGDLGFLRPEAAVAAGSGMVSADSLAIGTKHYRSVEQIDYSDTAEVDVDVGVNDDVAMLVTSDPKFLYTNIDSGDFVYFPKSNGRILYKIVNVSNDEASTCTNIQISVPSEGGTAAPENVRAARRALFNDSGTQAVFIKNPTARTDLFGLGAILFDIITAGDSPERFYELLRKFDRPGLKISESILAYYSVWQAQQTIDPEISAIFKRVAKEPGAGLSEEILKLLLRCCMSEPDDSFYNEFGFSRMDASSQDWNGVIAEIRGLIQDLDASSFRSASKNCLTSDNTPPPPPASESPRLLLKYIPLLAEAVHGKFLEDPDANIPVDTKGVTADSAASEGDKEGRTTTKASAEHAIYAQVSRTARGIKLVELVSKESIRLTRTIINFANNTDGTIGEGGFASLSPEHFTLSKAYNSIEHNSYFGMIDFESLKRKFENLDPRLCSLSPYIDKNMPVWWHNRSRRVDIRPQKSNTDMEYEYRYTDFMPSWDGIGKNDYLIVLNAGGKNNLYSITGIDEGANLVRCNDLGSLSEIESLSSLESTASYQTQSNYLHGFFLKNINAVDYCAGMISAYLFSCLFRNISLEKVHDFGRSVASAINSFPLKGLRKPSDYWITDNSKQEKSGSLFRKIFSNNESSERMSSDAEEASLALDTVRLCLWLMLGGYRRDENSLSSSEKLLQEIDTEINLWFRRAEERTCGIGYFGRVDLNFKSLSHGALEEFPEGVAHSFGMHQKEWDQIAKGVSRGRVVWRFCQTDRLCAQRALLNHASVNLGMK